MLSLPNSLVSEEKYETLTVIMLVDKLTDLLSPSHLPEMTVTFTATGPCTFSRKVWLSCRYSTKLFASYFLFPPPYISPASIAYTEILLLEIIWVANINNQSRLILYNCTQCAVSSNFPVSFHCNLTLMASPIHWFHHISTVSSLSALFSLLIQLKFYVPPMASAKPFLCINPYSFAACTSPSLDTLSTYSIWVSTETSLKQNQARLVGLAFLGQLAVPTLLTSLSNLFRKWCHLSSFHFLFVEILLFLPVCSLLITAPCTSLRKVRGSAIHLMTRSTPLLLHLHALIRVASHFSVGPHLSFGFKYLPPFLLTASLWCLPSVSSLSCPQSCLLCRAMPTSR